MVVAAAVNPVTARAEIGVPDCAALVQLGTQAVPGQEVPINDTPSRLKIPAPFADPQMAQLFGVPALDWTQADLASAFKQAGVCGKQAKKDRNKADSEALTNLWKGLGVLKHTLGAMTASERKLDGVLKALVEEPPSRAGLDSLRVVAAVRDGSAQAMEQATADLKASGTRLHAWTKPHRQAQAVLNILGDLPLKAWAPVFPPVDKRIGEVHDWAIDDASQQIAAVPETLQGLKAIGPLMEAARDQLGGALTEAEMVSLDDAGKARRAAVETAVLAEATAEFDKLPETLQGLRGLDTLAKRTRGQLGDLLSEANLASLDGAAKVRHDTIEAALLAQAVAQFDTLPENVQGAQSVEPMLQQTKAQLGDALSEADLASLDAAAKARREAIEDAIIGRSNAFVDAVPETMEGLAQLHSFQQSPGRSVLSQDRLAALDDRINARRAALAGPVTDQQIQQLGQFPETLDGLAGISNFETGTARNLQVLASADAAAKFHEAAQARATQIGEAAFDPFVQSIDKMPATEDGLTELESALTRIKGPIDELGDPLRARYVAAAVKRHDEITAAVQAEDVRLAALPLPGGVFVDKQSEGKIEFRDDKRLYFTMLGQTIEAGYETDGDRLIVQTPQGNQVFTREGPYIDGYGLKFKRQAAAN